MTGEGMTLEQIRQALSIVEEAPERSAGDGETLSLIPTIAGELDRLDTAYHAIMSELDQLRTDRAADRERLERLENWLRLPWWKRIFTQPPE
jgi:hypothetical protein